MKAMLAKRVSQAAFLVSLAYLVGCDARAPQAIRPAISWQAMPLEIPNFSEVLRAYTLIHGRVEAAASILVSGQISIDYYKVSTIEVLCLQPKISSEPLLDSLPQELFPLRPGEFLTLGGSSESIIGEDLFGQPAPEGGLKLKIGDQYLLAVFLESGGATGFPAGGPSTIYRIAETEIIPLVPSRDVYNSDLRQLFNNNLSSLKSYVATHCPASQKSL